MDYRIFIRRLESLIDQYFTLHKLQYEPVVDLIQDMYHLAVSQGNHAFSGKIQAIVSHLGAAMEHRDDILFIDLLEYEWIPTFHQWGHK